MTRVFADTCYWVALANRHDELHPAALAAQKRLTHATVVTTDEVLGEVLNFYLAVVQRRNAATQIVDAIRTDPHVLVLEQSRRTFDGGLTLYKGRSDKEYSHVDCISFVLMTQDGITDALTNDHHFEQEGFVALLRVSTS